MARNRHTPRRMATAPCDGLQGMVPPVPSANHLPPPMTGDGDHIAGKGVRPSVGVGAAQGPPLGGVLRVVGPDARPSAQAVANVLEGPGADREAAACGVGHEAGLAALVRRRVGATRHEAAPQQGACLAKARCRRLDRKDIERVGRQTRNGQITRGVEVRTA